MQSVLAKLSLCRTAALGGHVHECPQCQHRCPVYNSCLDRHCPLCSGGRRADWLTKTAELLLPKIDYFQVVFTVPAALAALMLGNRRTTYQLLFRAAWAALGEVLREEVGCEPAALMVLHTWNQRLEHHPHLHALVPGGGPSPDGQRWVRSGPRYPQRHDKPYLVDNRLLSQRFRDKFLEGLTRLRGQLKLQGPWSHLRDPAAFAVWLQTFRDCAWVVYIQPPPTQNAQPEQILKYLARYLTGGPISDHRLIAHQADRVTFWRVAQTRGPETNRYLIRSTESSSPVAGRCTFSRKALSGHAASEASVVAGGRPTSAVVASYSAWSHRSPSLGTRPRTNPPAPSPVRSAKHRWSASATSSVQAGTES